MNTQELAEFCPFVNCYQDIKQNAILTSIKGHNSVTNLQKMTGNKPNLYHVNITAQYFLSIFAKYFEQKQNTEIPIKGHNSVTNLQE